MSAHRRITRAQKNKLIERSLALMRKAICVVKEALPDTDPELIGGFFADLLDLWETGQKLDKELHRLTKLRFPEDREHLYDILIWISAIQVDMGSYWIGEVKKDIPKLLRALDKSESNSRSVKKKLKPESQRPATRRRATKSAKPAPNSVWFERHFLRSR
jgi:hypothetical protein